MAGPGSTWSGPLLSGTVKDSAVNAAGTFYPNNLGAAVLSQVFTLNPTGTATAWTFMLPESSIPLRLEGAVTTGITGGTAASLAIGTAAAGAQLGTLATLGTAAGAWVAGTLTALGVNPTTYAATNQLLYGTLNVTGSPSAGTVQVVLEYVQQVNTLAWEP